MSNADAYELRASLRGDHTANIAVLSGMRYRVRENVTKTYATAAGTCVVEGALKGVASQPEEVLAARDGCRLVRTRGMSVCNFEWLADSDVTLARRCTVSVTHCVTVVFDAFADGSVDARIVMRVGDGARHQLDRVRQLLAALDQGALADAAVTDVAASEAFAAASGGGGRRRP